MSLRQRLVLAHALGVVLTLTVGGCADNTPAHGGNGGGPGPLAGLDAKTAYVLPDDIGEVFTDGFAVIDLLGDEPATLLSIESIGGESSLEFLGAKIASPEREYATQQALPGWPSKKFDAELFDPVNLTIEPTAKTFNTQGYEILLGYRLKSREPAVRTAIRVTYKIGRTTYTAVLPSALAICDPGPAEDPCLADAFKIAGRE